MDFREEWQTRRGFVLDLQLQVKGSLSVNPMAEDKLSTWASPFPEMKTTCVLTQSTFCLGNHNFWLIYFVLPCISGSTAVIVLHFSPYFIFRYLLFDTMRIRSCLETSPPTFRRMTSPETVPFMVCSMGPNRSDSALNLRSDMWVLVSSNKE